MATKTSQEEMRDHAVAMNKANAALQVFLGQARLGNWAEAEKARNEHVAYIEAGLDAFIRASRLELNGG